MAASASSSTNDMAPSPPNGKHVRMKDKPMPPDDTVVLEWRLVQVTLAEVQEFVSTYYNGTFELARYNQAEHKGACTILGFQGIEPRALSHLLNDKIIKEERPVFAYPCFW